MNKARFIPAVCVVVLAAYFVCAAAYADKVFLKNGRFFECLIDKESDQMLELDIGFGKTRVLSSDIERIERYSREQNDALLDKWQRKRDRDEQDYKARQEQERKAHLAEQDAAEHAPKQVRAGQSAGGSIIVEALLNGKVRARLVVDTGAGMVVLSRAVAAQLGIAIPATGRQAGKADTIIQSVVADGRMVEAKTFTLESVQVQDARAANVAAAVILTDNSGKDFDGLLGMSFLKNFKFSLNTKEGTLTLEKHKEEGR